MRRGSRIASSRSRGSSFITAFALGCAFLASLMVAAPGSAAPDVSLDFDASAPGTVADGDGQGTGFTGVEPFSAGAGGDGHLPANLDLAGGALTVTSHFGDTTFNEQRNMLYVDYDGTEPVEVTTTLRGPVGVTASPQGGGLWVGQDDDNYVRLAVNFGDSGPRAQFIAENAGVLQFVDAIGDPSVASGDELTLRIRLDPVSGTASASYVVDGGLVTSVGQTGLPAGVSGPGAKAGLVSTHGGTGLPVDFAFEDFSVQPADSGEPTFAFEQRTTIVDENNASGIFVPTSMAIGPDGRLYVVSRHGKIQVFSLNADNNATLLHTIEEIFNRPNHFFDGVTPRPPNPQAPGRQTTGIAFDPASPVNAPRLYVSHSDPEIFTDVQPGQNIIDPTSGVITELTLNANGTVNQARDIVTGLPRSGENHSVNGMDFGPDGWLYMGIGGATNFGAPSKFFSYYPETTWSAAVARANPSAINQPVDVSGDSRFQFNDPCGPNESVDAGQCSGETTVPSSISEEAGQLQLYATGFRNPYDLAWHSNGRLYVNENEGNAGLGLTPGPNQSRLDSSGGPFACPGAVPTNPGTPPDQLFLIAQNGYYGHPNPARGECVRDGGAGALGAPFAQAIANYSPTKTSSNGIVEYTGNAFGGQLAGQLLTANYASGDNIVHVDIAPDGTAAAEPKVLASGLSDPLDVIVAGNGDVLVAEAGPFPGRISRLRPTAVAGCPDPGQIDDDGDGYTDQDEIANGTGPCNPADTPPDADADGVSDLNDPDDDNDGTPDAADQLQLDPSNGADTQLPFVLDFNSSDTGGFFGTGFLGVQLSSNGGGLAPQLGIGAGAAGGFLQVQTSQGTAAGAANDQDNPLQQGFDPGGNPFTVSTVLGEPFNTDLADEDGLPEGREAGGIFLGPNEDNFVRLGVHANNGAPLIELGFEQGGVFTRHPSSPSLPLPTDELRLFLDGDPATGQVRARYELGQGGSIQTIATVPVPGAWLGGTSLAGIMASDDPVAGESQPFIFDEFRIESGTGLSGPTGPPSGQPGPRSPTPAPAAARSGGAATAPAAARSGGAATATVRPVGCRGRAATIVGTPGDDFLRGTRGDDVIVALAGDDRIVGSRGDDLICAGAGRDTVLAGSGRDTVLGQAGRDLLRGQRGRDLLVGGRGADTLRGEAGGDVLRGGPGNDVILGGAGPDRGQGNAGRDRLVGGAGPDRLRGGRARDVIVGHNGRDRLFGGAGNDNLLGGRGRDILVGNAGRRDRGVGGPGRDAFRSIEIRLS